MNPICIFELSKFNSCHKGIKCNFNHNQDEIIELRFIINNYKNLKLKFEENNKVIQSIKEENKFLKDHLNYINSKLLENNINLVNTQEKCKLLTNENAEQKNIISKLEFCKKNYDTISLLAIESDNNNKILNKELNDLKLNYNNLKQNYDYLHYENINMTNYYKEININNKILYLDECKKYNDFKHYKIKIEEIIMYYKNIIHFNNEIKKNIDFMKDIPINIRNNFLIIV